MRYGYAMLLREFLEADEVEFGDCEQFQIVCPACREAVFKKTRNRPDGQITHFLSHYKAETDEEKDCELRVDAIAKEHLDTYNTETRGQALKLFMGVLRKSIIEGQRIAIDPVEHTKRINRLLSKPDFRAFADAGHSAVRYIFLMPAPRKAIAQMLATFPRFSDRSPFWQRRQAAYIEDLLIHLQTPQARGNLDFLSASAVVNIASNAVSYRRKYEAAKLQGDDLVDTNAVSLLCEAIVQGKSHGALVKMTRRLTGVEKIRNPDVVEQRINDLYRGIALEMIGPMVGILAAVPWPDVAKGKPFESVEPKDPLLNHLESFMNAILDLTKDRQDPPVQ